MKLVEFPNPKGSRYYDSLIRIYESIFKSNNYTIKYANDLKYIAPGIPELRINNNIIVLDLSDYNDEYAYKLVPSGISKLHKIYDPETLHCPIFKRLMSTTKNYNNNIFPLGLFYPDAINLLDTLFNYKNDIFKSNIVINSNRIYAGAQFTRKIAFDKINKKDLINDIILDTRRVPLTEHLKRLTTCLGNIQISGACNHTVDPGHCTSFILGVCTISNNCNIRLPYDKSLKENYHYLELNPDYSNINDCINFLYSHRDICKDIGNNVYKLARETSTPKLIVDWIVETSRTFYE